MSLRKFMSMFKHSRYLEEGDVVSCDCVEDVAQEIRRGNKELKKAVIKLALNQRADWNARGSALETLAAGLIPQAQTELSLVLREILKEDGDDPSMHHHALAIFGDMSGFPKADLRALVEEMSKYCDHRGRFAGEILGVCYGDSTEE